MQDEDIWAFDEFAFLIKRLQCFCNSLLPALILVFQPLLRECSSFQRRHRIILEGAGFAAFYPAFLLKRVQNLVDFAVGHLGFAANLHSRHLPAFQKREVSVDFVGVQAHFTQEFPGCFRLLTTCVSPYSP